MIGPPGPAAVVGRRGPAADRGVSMADSSSKKKISLSGDRQIRAIRIYLREIGEISLLSREEEKCLAGELARGDEEARKQMIRANLRLVVKIAKKYEHLGLPLLDLIEEGNLGLIKGVDRYDLSRGTKLSTYAAWWIKQSIMRALANKGKMIRIPVYMQEKVNTFRKNVNRLSQQLGRHPSNDEISEKLDLTLREIDHLEEVARVPSSLDAALDRNGAGKLADMIEDTETVAPDRAVDTADLHQGLLYLITELPEREKAILEMRFGLGGKEARTLSAIGKKFGISRERVRQIINKAIRRLRQIIGERDLDMNEFNRNR
ncbi:MAG: RNA polymerase sigma factor RpoD/SigA [PVC group bacterium]